MSSPSASPARARALPVHHTSGQPDVHSPSHPSADEPPIPVPSFSWTTFAKFLGPGFFVAIGYLDPGNWASDLAAGSQFGYGLLYIVLAANLMAVLLQHLCIKLGCVTNRDLAQACRRHFHPYLNMFLYVLCELAIIATDVAEVVGTAIALKLLFGLPLPLGVLITAADVLVILLGWDVKHLRFFEFFIVLLMAIVGGCFAVLVGMSKPNWTDVLAGFVPTKSLFTDPAELYIAMAICGATIMPHNLFLHSNLVKFRATNTDENMGEINSIEEPASASVYGSTIASVPPLRPSNLPLTLKMTNLDSGIALTFAFLINAAILIVASANFHAPDSSVVVAELEDAYVLLTQYLGKAAGLLFAVALLGAGQSSSLTGTMAGQICMEGFLGEGWSLEPWLRRLVTRGLAIVPSLAVALLRGDEGVSGLLVLSQVVLSVQLAFAVWPLIYFTSSDRIMTVRVRHHNALPTTTTSTTSSPSPTSSHPFPSDATESTNLLSSPSPPSPSAALPPPAPSSGRLFGRPKPVVTAPHKLVSFANSRVTVLLAGSAGVLITVFNGVLLVQIARGKT